MKPKSGVFVIAGGSRGLAVELAETAVRAGFSVALIARTRSDLAAARKRVLEKIGKQAEVCTYVADLRDERKSVTTFKSIVRSQGSIAVLVNNVATWTGGQTVLKLDALAVRRALDLNFFTVFNATKACLGVRGKKEKRKLTIINVGATSSLQGWPGVFAFSVGKGAVRTLSQSLAREIQPTGVHVCHLVIDGLLDNERTRKLNPKLASNRFMGLSAVSKTILHIVGQEKSAWTFELDLRPYNEDW